MSQKQRGLIVVATLLISTVLISSCTFSLSNAPAATPTLIPTGLFVSPFPSVENPMDMIQQFAQQTAAAQTSVAAGGTPGTPSTVVTAVTGTVLTPQTGVTATITPTSPNAVTPTNATTAVVVPSFTPGGPTSTPLPPGVRPTRYELMPGEFPYCIARRFDVNPDELLSINGLTNGQIYYPHLTLQIPQTGNRFPTTRALTPHPATYTVISSDETLNSVACKYGDVEPGAIATASGISPSAALTVGQKLTIP